MAYHWATSCVEETDTVWLATIVLLASADFWMRESILVVMTAPILLEVPVFFRPTGPATKTDGWK